MSLKFEQALSGRNPFDEIHCVLCNCTEFTSIDHASVWCDKCNAAFTVESTSNDPGYSVDCCTKWAWITETIHPQLIGDFKIYCIVKNDEPPRWRVIYKHPDKNSPDSYSVEKFLKLIK